jgi:hypothetical protein
MEGALYRQADLCSNFDILMYHLDGLSPQRLSICERRFTILPSQDGSD